MCNIVHCYESFRTHNDTHLVFEVLDITLLEYMEQRNFKALPLDQVRSIIQQVRIPSAIKSNSKLFQFPVCSTCSVFTWLTVCLQMAVAFHALKSIGVIHTDVKTDNIMVVNRFQKPLRVKLIDFGLAIHVSKAKQGSLHQPTFYRWETQTCGPLFHWSVSAASALSTSSSLRLLSVIRQEVQWWIQGYIIISCSANLVLLLGVLVFLLELVFAVSLFVLKTWHFFSFPVFCFFPSQISRNHFGSSIFRGHRHLVPWMCDGWHDARIPALPWDDWLWCGEYFTTTNLCYLSAL